MNEKEILYRSIMRVKKTKFTKNDLPLFETLMSEYFPGILLKEDEHPNYRKAVEETLVRMNLQPTKEMVEKTIEFNNTKDVRHGLMVLG